MVASVQCQLALLLPLLRELFLIGYHLQIKKAFGAFCIVSFKHSLTLNKEIIKPCKP